jgi:uncharacterized protein
MRVVIDTNVIVSGVLNPHVSLGRIVNAPLSGTATVLYDDRILSEYREVLLRPVFGFQRSDVNVLLDFIETDGIHTNARPLTLVLLDHPYLLPAFSQPALHVG